LSTDSVEEVTESPVTEEVTENVEETSPSDQTTEEVTTEETEESTTESETPTEEAETETEESDDAPELPTKQAKKYSPELMDHYADKFGLTADELKQPKWQSLIKSKIDGDIFIAQQEERLAALESEEATEEATTEEAPQVVEAAKPATPEQRAAYIENLRKFSKEVTEPEMATSYAKSWCKSQGVDYEKAVKGGFNPEEFVQEQTMYAANLVNTILPRLMPSFLSAAVEAVFPGFGKMYEGALHANTWEEVRSSDANFKALHAFGTPEYQAAYKAALKANPWIEQAQFTDPKTGRPLSVPQTVATRYRIVAQYLSGQKVTPQTVQDAVNKGKQDATRSNRRVSASGALKGGRTTGTIGKVTEKPEGGSMMDAYNKQHSGVV
jgi:hypothetical protein